MSAPPSKATCVRGTGGRTPRHSRPRLGLGQPDRRRVGRSGRLPLSRCRGAVCCEASRWAPRPRDAGAWCWRAAGERGAARLVPGLRRGAGASLAPRAAEPVPWCWRSAGSETSALGAVPGSGVLGARTLFGVVSPALRERQVLPVRPVPREPVSGGLQP